MNRRQFIKISSLAGAGLTFGDVAYPHDDREGDTGFLDDQSWLPRRKRLNVCYEWSTLREVVVGYPLLKLSNRFPPETENWLKFPPEYQALFEFWLTYYPGKTLEEIAKDPDLPKPEIKQLYEAQVKQIGDVIRLLQSLGVVVHQIPPLSSEEQAYLGNIDGNVCQLFPRDPMLVVGEKYFELPLMLPYRRRERFAIRHVTSDLLESLDNPIRSAPEPYPLPGDGKGFGPSAFLEGGDVLVFGKDLLVGTSGNASNLAGITWLKQQLGPSYAIETVPLKPDFLHLDVALCTPRPGLALVCRGAFLNGLPRFLRGWKLIDIAEEDALDYLACNALILDRQSIIVVDQPSYIGDQLENAGQTVYRMPFDMLTPLGGGFRCWHHPLRRC